MCKKLKYKQIIAKPKYKKLSKKSQKHITTFLKLKLKLK